MSRFAGIIASSHVPAAGGFNPQTDITWEHLWWCESTDFIAEGYANGNEITSFPDSSGTATLTPASSGSGPLYVSSDSNFDGKPSAAFTLDSDGSVATLDATVSTPLTVVFIARSDVTDTGRRGILGNGTAARVRTSASGAGEWRAETATGSLRESTKLAGTSTAPVFCEAVFAGASSKLREDGTTLATGDPGTTSLATAFGVNTYGDNTSQLGLPIDFVLIGVYDGDITAHGEYANFKTWVTDHYGITIA